jgi:hypothetical protein
VLSENIPTARAVVIKDTGHFPHMEKPETVNGVLWEWLEEKVDRSSRKRGSPLWTSANFTSVESKLMALSMNVI